YAPVVIRKFTDSSTPLLYRALVTGQSVNAALKFFRNNPDGKGENYYNVTLKVGHIASIDAYSPDNQSADGSVRTALPMEEVSFTFSSITWQFGENTFTDNVSAKF